MQSFLQPCQLSGFQAHAGLRNKEQAPEALPLDRSHLGSGCRRSLSGTDTWLALGSSRGTRPCRPSRRRKNNPANHGAEVPEDSTAAEKALPSSAVPWRHFYSFVRPPPPLLPLFHCDGVSTGPNHQSAKSHVRMRQPLSQCPGLCTKNCRCKITYAATELGVSPPSAGDWAPHYSLSRVARAVQVSNGSS